MREAEEGGAQGPEGTTVSRGDGNRWCGVDRFVAVRLSWR